MNIKKKKNIFLPMRKQCDFFVTKLKNGINFDPYREYEHYIEKKKVSSGDAPNILITIINGAYGHTFEGLYARKAMLQGRKVSVLCCGNYLSHCEAIQEKAKNKNLRCAICLAQQEEFMRAFEADCYTYGSVLDQSDEEIINDYTATFFNDIFGKHIFLDTEIDNILYTALQRYYLIADPVVRDDAVTRGFLHTIIATLIVMDKLVNRLHPKYVLSSHGTYSTWGSVVEYCKSHNIYVITHGQNYNHCGIEFTYDDSYLTGVLNDTGNAWQDQELSERARNLSKRFLDERLGRVSDETVAFDYNKNNKSHFSHEKLCEMLGIPEKKKIVGLFPNIPWDGQVTGTSAVFPRFRDWLKTTVDFFACRNDAVLVIRAHPAEMLNGDEVGRETTATMLAEMYPKLPENVILLDPKHVVNSYTLGENADFGIVYSSTVTLELTYLGTPIILCGCPPFRNKGIAFDISSVENYIDLLETGLAGGLHVDDIRKETLYKFIHYFYFMRTMPQTLVDIKDTVPKKYFFTSEEQLDADPVFDAMFRYIENKEEMDFSHFYK